VAGEARYDETRNFFLRFRAADFEHRSIPDEFINRLRKKNWIECQTLRIIQLNQRISDSAVDVVSQSDKVVSELLVEVRRFAPEMFRVCESIALLDVLAAFGQIVTTGEYIRPLLDGRIALKAARHPILEKVGIQHIRERPLRRADNPCRRRRCRSYQTTTMLLSSTGFKSLLAVT
jgi:DNA mismatch repair protein MSH4